MSLERRRIEDQNLTGWRAVTCWLAQRASEFWDWVDKRDLDKHVVSIAIMYGTVKVTDWAMDFAATHGEKSGIEAAAIIAAVAAPYMALQAAAIAFYFRARQ